MAQPQVPGVSITEEATRRQPISGVSTAVAGIAGIAQRGPIGESVSVKSFAAFERIYGGAMAGESLHYAVRGFFNNGGTEVYVNRLGHLSDPADKNTLVGSAAGVDLAGFGGPAYATLTGGPMSEGVVLPTGEVHTFDLAVNLGSPQTATITTKPAEMTGASASFPATAGASCFADYSVNGGPTKRVDLSTNTPPTADAAGYASLLGQLMDGVKASTVTGDVIISTDRRGSSASIEIVSVGADFAAETGFSVGSAISTGNDVADADSVSLAELQTVLDRDVQDGNSDPQVDVGSRAGFLVLVVVDESVSAVTSDLLSSNFSTGLDIALGLANGQQVGGQPGSMSLPYTIRAGYKGIVSPGQYGNRLAIVASATPKAESEPGVALTVDANAGSNELQLVSAKGITEGSILMLVDGMSMELVRVLGVTTQVSGSGVTRTALLDAALVNSFTSASTALASTEVTLIVYDGRRVLETIEGVSFDPAREDFIVSRINDTVLGSVTITVEDHELLFPESVAVGLSKTPLTGGTSETVGFADADVVGVATARTGLYVFDGQPINSLACPPSFGGTVTIGANPIVHTALSTYSEDRHDCYPVLDFEVGMTPEAALNYRSNVLGLDTAWGAIYYPALRVADPLSSAKNGVVDVPNSGHILGLYARVDAMAPPNGGVSTAPAGEGAFGKIHGVLGLAFQVDDKVQGTLNPEGINAIRNFVRSANPGVTVYGARTLSSSQTWRYIQVRRLLTYVEQSIIEGSRYAVFRDNDFLLWGELSDRVTTFLRRTHSSKMLAGRTSEEAFYVRIDESTTTSDEIDSGVLLGEIGIAPKKPAEFIRFRFGLLESGQSTITEL